MSYKIIDVSKYQGVIDWASVKASGIDGAMLRAVSTNNNGIYIDPFFEINYQGCKENDIPVGVYYYTYATDMDTTLRELAYLKSALNDKIFDLPIAIDVEDSSLTNISKSELTRLVEYALQQIESWGSYAMLYTYTNFKQNFDYQGLRQKYDSWIADYRGICPADAGIWQYTSKGSISGISGNVDISTTEINYPKIIYDKSLNCFMDVPPADKEEDAKPMENDKKTIFEKIIKFIDKIIHLIMEVFIEDDHH